MKKLLSPVLLILLLAVPARAQKIYFRGGLGYALPHAGAVQGPIFSYSANSFFPTNGSYNGTYLPTNTSETFEMKKVSYTSGLQGILALGAMINKNIGVEVAANLGLVTKKMETTIFTEQPGLKTWLNTTQQSDLPVLVTPALVIQTGGKINLYARGGIVLPVKTGMLQEVKYAEEKFNPADSSIVRRTVNLTEEFHMKMTPGFSGAMGVKWKTQKGLTLWAEASILSMTLYYNKSEITSLTQNGQSVLNQLTPQERTTQYEFKGTISGNSNLVPTLQAPYSNFSIQAGVSVDLF